MNDDEKDYDRAFVWVATIVVLIALGVTLVLYFLTGCCKTCPPTLPPEIVTVHETCMEPLPTLPIVVWPEPDDPRDPHSTFIVTSEQARGLARLLTILRGYLDAQLARCKVAADGASPNTAPVGGNP